MVYEINEATKELMPLLQQKKLCIFVGAGISCGSGLPDWIGLIDLFIDICEKINNSLRDEDRFTDIIEDAKVMKSKNPIKTISALKRKVAENKNKGVDIEYYVDKLRTQLKGSPTYSINENHKLIVKTDFQYILTSNYDNLLEEAAEENNISYLINSSYSFDKPDLISQALYEDKPAIIHIHGKASQIDFEKIVITSEDYHKIKKNNMGFKQVLNNIFMNYSILFVGYGGTDPHLEEIIEEITFALKWNNSMLKLPNYYLIQERDKISPIIELDKNCNRTHIIAIDKYSDVTTLLTELYNKYPRII